MPEVKFGDMVDYRVSDMEVRKAVVTKVWTDTCVNLFICEMGERTSVVKGTEIGQWM